MNLIYKLAFFLGVAFFLWQPLPAPAEFSPHEVMAAQQSKQEIYVMDAIVRGGDPTAKSASLTNLRWAKKQGYERIVLDLAGEGANWQKSSLPYFQVGLNPQAQKVSVDIRGVINRKLTQENATRALRRSAYVKEVYLAPPLQGDLLSLEMKTKQTVDVEAFYLVGPPRIILDIRAKR